MVQPGLREGVTVVADAALACLILSRFGFSVIPTFWAWLGLTVVALVILGTALGAILAVEPSSAFNADVALAVGTLYLVGLLWIRAMALRTMSNSSTFRQNREAPFAPGWAFVVSICAAAGGMGVGTVFSLAVGP